MSRTYEPIATQTLGSNTATVTFTSIPATYTDLMLIAVCKSTTSGTGANNIRIQLNNDTGSNYSNTEISGNGTNAFSARYSNQTVLYTGYIAQATPNAAVSIIHFMNYSNTTTNKTVLSRGNAADANALNAIVGLWRSTAAISEIDLFMSSADVASGSTFTLYGIKAA